MHRLTLAFRLAIMTPHKRVIAPLHQTIANIAEWYDTPLGKCVLAAEQQVLNDELSCLFGYHLMQLSVLPHHRLSESSRINHCFTLAPSVVDATRAREQLCDVQGLSELDALPLADESIDVTILHHVLEFSSNPHQVLKEAARVTVARGHIVLFAFNPISAMGLMQLCCQFFSKQAIWQRRPLRISRMRDWLEFLDFSCLGVRHVSHNLPINNARYLGHSQFAERRISNRLPLSNVYCIVARKDKVGLTPIKPAWENSRFLGAQPLPKRSMSSRSPESALILPLRRRNRIK